MQYLFCVFDNVGKNIARGDTRSTASGCQNGPKKAAGENIITNTTPETATSGDALCAESFQYGIHIFGRFGTRGRFHNKRTGNTATS